MIVPFQVNHFGEILDFQAELYQLNFSNIVIDQAFYQPIIHWYTLVLSGDLHAYVFIEEGKTVGFYLYQTEREAAYLMQMFVHASHRGTVTSFRLLQHFEQEAKKRGIELLYLHVSAANPQAVTFYQKNGFYLIDQESQEGELRYVMKKDL